MFQPIKHFSPREVRREIQKLNSKKAPGYDLINPKVLKELPKKGVVATTQIYNAIIRIQYSGNTQKSYLQNWTNQLKK